MTYIFVYQSYTQQTSLTQDDVFENVLCNVFEGKAFGKTFLKFIPVTNELLDTTDSDSVGDSDTIAPDQV